MGFEAPFDINTHGCLGVFFGIAQSEFAFVWEVWPVRLHTGNRKHSDSFADVSIHTFGTLGCQIPKKNFVSCLTRRKLFGKSGGCFCTNLNIGFIFLLEA